MGVEEVEAVAVVVFYGKCSIGCLVVVFIIAAPYVNTRSERTGHWIY